MLQQIFKRCLLKARMIDVMSLIFYPWILIGLPYLLYICWPYVVLRFLAVCFVLPYFSFYPTIIMIITSYIYKFLAKFIDDKNESLRFKFVKAMSNMWWIIARVYHGYEVHGLEHVPANGALIVYYHGMVPIDIGYITAVFPLFKGKMVEGIVDRNLFRIPGIQVMSEVMGGTCQGRDYCINQLRMGKYMSLSPGGTYEAMFSTNYRLELRQRRGFAHIAKDAGVPIVPMFTENIRQYTDMWTFGLRDYIERLYAAFRFPLMIALGGAPVKLRTFLGPPIYCGEHEDVDDFAQRVMSAIEDLRDLHQTQPGSVFSALLQRFY